MGTEVWEVLGCVREGCWVSLGQVWCAKWCHRFQDGGFVCSSPSDESGVLEARRELGQPTLSKRGTDWCVGRGQKEGLSSSGPGAMAQRYSGRVTSGTMAVSGYKVEGGNEGPVTAMPSREGQWGRMVPIPLLLERVAKALWLK